MTETPTNPDTDVEGPTTVARVREYLMISDTGALDAETDKFVPIVVAAVNAWVSRFTGREPGEHVVHGATMLAAKVLGRRNTPSGTMATGEFGIFYVARTDPEIAMLLGLGKYQRPVVF